MINRTLGLIDKLTYGLFCVSFLATLVMIAAIAVEVWSRYVLNAPTVWAFDITYMANGTVFMFAAAWTLREDRHVRVDILDARFGPFIRRMLDGAFYLFLCMPVLSTLSWFAVSRAWKSYISSEVEMVSPWQPLIWPFQTILAIGLIALALQCAAQGLRSFIGGRANAMPRHAAQQEGAHDV